MYVIFRRRQSIKSTNLFQTTSTPQPALRLASHKSPKTKAKLFLLSKTTTISPNTSPRYSIMSTIFLWQTTAPKGSKWPTNNNPDLIISDVMMPVMDGVEMTNKIKANFDICHIPVVMLTAKTTTSDKIKGVQAGAEAYVTKPFSGTYLTSVVQNLLKQRQLVMHRLQDKNELGPQNLNISEKDETFLSDLIKYIEENYQNNKLSVEELSEALCVSRTVFYNKVKSLTGLSPIEFIRQMKLKIGAQLLGKGYNVSEVALLVGYNDIKYFSRKFKEQFGYPPSKHNKMTDEQA